MNLLLMFYNFQSLIKILIIRYEPFTPFWKQRLPYTILSSSVVILLIMIALASVIGVIIYRVSVRAAIAQIDEKYSSIFTSVSAATINLFFILILNQLYSHVTFYLTELEIPRTQSDFDNSLTLKMYLLQFVNYYSSIFCKYCKRERLKGKKVWILLADFMPKQIVEVLRLRRPIRFLFFTVSQSVQQYKLPFSQFYFIIQKFQTFSYNNFYLQTLPFSKDALCRIRERSLTIPRFGSISRVCRT